MSHKMSQRNRLIAIAVAVGLVLLALALRMSLRQPPRPPADPSAKFFTLTIVAPNIDPILLEREQKSFDVNVAELRKNPDFFDGWMAIGNIKKMMGDFGGAADIFEHAGQIRPGNSISFNNLGDLYANYLNDYPKAEAAFRQAIKNSTGEEKNPLFYLNLVDLYRYRYQDSVKAMAALEEGISANPQLGYILMVKAAQYAAELGQRDQALQYYRQAMELQPNNQELAEEYRKYRDGR